MDVAHRSAVLDLSMLQQVRMLIYKDEVQLADSSTLDPGGHLPSLDVTSLLPFHLPRIAGDRTSCTMLADVSARRNEHNTYLYEELALTQAREPKAPSRQPASKPLPAL